MGNIMAFFKKRQAPVSDARGLIAPVRLVTSIGDLSGVRAGDIVLIEQEDLDFESAQTLVTLQISAVVNSHSSVTGREPVKGAAHLVENQIVVLDEVGEGLWSSLRNGDLARIDGNEVFREDAVLATGVLLTAERIVERLDEASSGLSNRLDAVVTNATDLVRRERAMLIDGERIPRVTHSIKGRPVLVVVPGENTHAELRSLRRFVIDHDPVLVGVGEGADELLRVGYGIDLLVGHAAELESKAINKADEIVLVSSDGRWDQPERFEKHGKQPVLFTAPGAAQDLAVLLVDHHEAALIVLVGTSSGIEELTARDPVDVAGSLVTRLRSSSRIIDAAAVSYFARKRIGIWAPLVLLAAGCLAVAIALNFAVSGQELLDVISAPFSSIFTSIRGMNS
ncbi:MAG: hypothetical protein GX678_07775 [Actinomycetales bacterium]|nr:hypothetical protein [Actinomycetales bacterium]